MLKRQAKFWCFLSFDSSYQWSLLAFKLLAFSKLSFGAFQWTHVYGMIPSYFFYLETFFSGHVHSFATLWGVISLSNQCWGQGSRSRPSSAGQGLTDVPWVYECCCSCSFSRSSSLLRCFARRLRDQLRKSHSQSQSFAISPSQLATLGILVAGPIWVIVIDL